MIIDIFDVSSHLITLNHASVVLEDPEMLSKHPFSRLISLLKCSARYLKRQCIEEVVLLIAREVKERERSQVLEGDAHRQQSIAC